MLKTGADDKGNKFSLYYNTFGDYRPTGIFYFTMPSIYVFGEKLSTLVSGRELFGEPMRQVPHPFAPGEIKLERYLKGIFTSVDVDETKQWISGIVGRDIPVGSIDALATWEDVLVEIPLVRTYIGNRLQCFYFDLVGWVLEELRSEGVEAKQVHDCLFCTSCLNNEFPSYRKEAAHARRMWSVLTLI